ncbi:MAG TPA: hypothetical protein VII63_08870 [Caulobacteraceae bacterium]
METATARAIFTLRWDIVGALTLFAGIEAVSLSRGHLKRPVLGAAGMAMSGPPVVCVLAYDLYRLARTGL